MKISSGKIPHAKKVVIYGPEGIGKTTFATKFPDPLFIDTEGGTKEFDIKRFETPTSWTMLKEQIKYTAKEKPCKTLVIDTLDRAEQLCIESILSKYDKKGIEDFGYGNGYVYEKEEFARFLLLLDSVIDAGINLVILAHAQMRKFEQPDEAGAYDRWELKLGKKTSSQISPLVKEWADMVLFANYKTFAVASDDKGKKFKAQGGRRVMYTAHHPCWDAKNRYGLKEELSFDYNEISQVIENNGYAPPTLSKTVEHEDFTEITDEPEEVSLSEMSTKKKPPEDTDGIPQRLLDLMKLSGVTEEEIRKTVFDRGHYPESTPIKNYDTAFIDGWIIAHWQSVVDYINNKLR